MAYMNNEGKGPYPAHRGEYCGNHYLKDSKFSLRYLNESPEDAARHHAAWLGKMRFGKPHSCAYGSSEKMAAEGYVGLYLREDSKLMDWRETACWTPPELMEPEFEIFYNIGVPGLCHVIHPPEIAQPVEVETPLSVVIDKVLNFIPETKLRINKFFDPDGYKLINNFIKNDFFKYDFKDKLPYLK